MKRCSNLIQNKTNTYQNHREITFLSYYITKIFKSLIKHPTVNTEEKEVLSHIVEPVQKFWLVIWQISVRNIVIMHLLTGDSTFRNFSNKYICVCTGTKIPATLFIRVLFIIVKN